MTDQEPQWSIQVSPSQTGPLDQPASPHVHKTHTFLERIQAFEKLSLFNKLTLNKEIEQANLVHEHKYINHLMDLINHPVDSSLVASLLTIKPDEINQLCIPSIFEKFKDLINASLYFALSKLSKKTRRQFSHFSKLQVHLHFGHA